MIIATDHATILYYARQYERSIEEFRAVLQMDPSFVHGHTVIDPYVAEKRFEEALVDLQKWPAAGIDTVWQQSGEAFVYANWGHEAEARRVLTTYEKRIHGRWFEWSSGSANREWVEPSSDILSAYIKLGRQEEAIALLQKAYAVHSNMLVELKVNPKYDPLRSDAHFQDLLRRVGLAN